MPAAALFVVTLFLGMLLLLDVGRRIGIRRLAIEAERARAGFGVIDGAVFGLLGLLIAFTFSSAASRFDARRLDKSLHQGRVADARRTGDESELPLAGPRLRQQRREPLQLLGATDDVVGLWLLLCGFWCVLCKIRDQETLSEQRSLQR